MSEISSRLEQSLVLQEPPTLKDHNGGCVERNSERTWSTESSYSLSDLDESLPPTEDDEDEAPATTAQEQQNINTESSKSASSCKIRFGQVNVRLFQIIPGVHPDCVKGPPITIDWDPFEEYSTDINDFEEERLPDRYHDEQLRMSWLDRRCRLKRSGFGEVDLKHAADSSSKLRRHRDRTMRTANNERFEMAQEAVFRKIRRGFRPKITLTTKY